MPSTTPITDRMMQTAGNIAPTRVVVPVAVARELELEIAGLHAECTRLRAESVAMVELCNENESERASSDSEIERLHAALALLLREVELSGNGTSGDFGWPAAVAAARASLGVEP